MKSVEGSEEFEFPGRWLVPSFADTLAKRAVRKAAYAEVGGGVKRPQSRRCAARSLRRVALL